MYAMYILGSVHKARKEYEQAVTWFTKGAEAGLPKAMFKLGLCLDSGEGVAAPDYPAAANFVILLQKILGHPVGFIRIRIQAFTPPHLRPRPVTTRAMTGMRY